MKTLLAFLVALITSCSGASAQEGDTLRELLIQYRCPVVDSLDGVTYAGDRTSQKDRFIVVARADRAQSYVQCLFFDSRKHLVCEASSGFYYDKPGAPRSLVHKKALSRRWDGWAFPPAARKAITGSRLMSATRQT